MALACKPIPKIYYCADTPDGLPDGPFDVASGRGLQPVVPFPEDGPDRGFWLGVGMAPPIVTQTVATQSTPQTATTQTVSTNTAPPTSRAWNMTLRQRSIRLNPEEPAPSGLERFLDAQNNVVNGYEKALTEMRAGAKRSHWIWYIFPQLTGVASSPTTTCVRYAVRNLAEAVEYLRHPVLGVRLREIVEVVAASATSTAATLMGNAVDALKLKSCMTLFRRAEEVLYAERGYVLTWREDRYLAVLKKYYGEECQRTLQMLG